MTSNNLVQLTLCCAPDVANEVVDFLLQALEDTTFQSFPGRTHGLHDQSMSVFEQVAGYKEQMIFTVEVSAARAEALLGDLRAAMGGSGLQYWVVPVLESGQI